MGTAGPPSIRPRIGFVGLGLMGTPMAQRLRAAGLAPTVWTRNAAKRHAAGEQGLRTAATAGEVVEQADVVCLSLASEAAVEEVFSGETGLCAAPLEGKIIVDTSTISPATTLRLFERTARRGGSWLDAPVSGGVPGARAGSLTVFAGGTRDALAHAEPVLRCFGRRITYMGGPGAGQQAKVLNQLIVAVNVMAIAEAIALAKAAGLDAEHLPEALRGGFADSQPLQIFGPRMARGDFESVQTGIGLMIKDLGYARGMAEQAGLRLPLADAVAELYTRISAVPGLAPDCDVTALVKLFDRSPGGQADEAYQISPSVAPTS